MKVLRHQIDNEINSLLCLQGAENVVQIESIYKNSTDVQLVTKYGGEYNLEEFISLVKLEAREAGTPYTSYMTEP